MVTGFTKFRERFQGFEHQYVVIGGTACDLLMEEEKMTFRATKDIDIVLIVEAMTKEFGQQFWEYINSAFVAGRPNSVFCSGKCKDQYNVYKSRAKDKDGNN